MKELDFDELDRAVNSLMTNVPKDAGASDELSEKTLDITPTLGKDEAPSFDTQGQPALRPTTASVTVPARGAPSIASPKTPPPAARRSGRFMDVVHPSSNMKKDVSIPAPVSRHGATIEPGTSFEPPQSVVSTTASPVEPKTAALPTPGSVARSAPKSDWPDPLDVAGFNPSGSEPQTTEKKDEGSTAPLIDTSEASDKTVDDKKELAPLTSPFLPDTKVEKRPLGSPSDASESDHTPVLSSESSSNLMVDDPTAQLPAIPKDVEPVLPAELHKDLVAVEADTSPTVAKEEIETTSASQASASSSTSAPEMPAGPTSIAQQYREEPSTGDKDSGAIYDTDTYHQPLAHPAKKKSGWLWVLWIALILVVGAGAGAGAYYLHLF